MSHNEHLRQIPQHLLCKGTIIFFLLVIECYQVALPVLVEASPLVLGSVFTTGSAVRPVKFNRKFHLYERYAFTECLAFIFTDKK